jgi:hypothetical protein
MREIDVESVSSEDSSIVVELELQKDGHIGGTSKNGIDLDFRTFSGFFSDPNLGFYNKLILESLRNDAQTLFFRSVILPCLSDR